MELILASGTPKNFILLLKSRLSTDRAPVMKLTWSTFQFCRWITVLMATEGPGYRRSQLYYLRVGGPLFHPAASTIESWENVKFLDIQYDSVEYRYTSEEGRSSWQTMWETRKIMVEYPYPSVT
jgi:hypothetical protein